VLLATTLVRSRPYAPVIRRLAERFHVYAVDMPGCGRGSRLSRTWGFEQYARWADRLLDRLGLEQVTLVGHSNSAGAALVVGAVCPGRVRRIVLADGVGADESPSYFRVLLGRALDAFLEPWLSLTGWHHLFYNLLFHTRNFLGQIKASIKTDLRPYARRVTVPTLIAWGAHDHTMPPRCADVLQKLLPRPSLHVSPTGSHDWIITHPDEFAAAVSAFADET
jgi:pimeloyl-ACP methyl ester carboxylesterase